jgi:hypothetical protein
LHASFDGLSDRIKGNPKNPLDSSDHVREHGAVAEPYDHAVAQRLDASYGKSLKRKPQGALQHAQEIPAVPALEPDFMVMHDDDGFAHDNSAKIREIPDCLKVYHRETLLRSKAPRGC